MRLTAIVALMAVFTLAICFVIIGAVSVELKAALGIGNPEIGTLVMTLFLTGCIVELFVGPLVDKLGHKPVVIAGFLICAAGIFLLGYASTFSVALIAAFLLGVGGMCVNTVGNTLIPIVLFDGKDPARASTFGNAFFGLGLICVPLVVSLSGLHYAKVLFLLGLVIVAFLLFSLRPQYPKVAVGFTFSMVIKLLRHAPVVMAALALACYISLESTMSTWIKPFMAELLSARNSPHSLLHAGFVLSLFGVSMTLGRFISSGVKNLTRIGTAIVIGAGLTSIAAITLLIMTTNIFLAIAAVVCLGVVFAPVFPVIVGVTFARYEPKLYGSIFGLLFSIGLLGGTFVPQYVGVLAQGKSIQQSLWIAVVMAGLLCVITILMRRLSPRSGA